jgi:hypothetical protein
MVNHPLFNLRRIVDAYGPSIDWEFASMELKVYTRRETADHESYYYERTHHAVCPLLLLELGDTDGIKRAYHINPDEDISIGNRIHVDNRNAGPSDWDQGTTYFYPQADFATGELDSDDIWKVEDVSRLSLYRSGRSFHGYGQHLIGKDAWMQYMGMLLLLNQKGESGIIDARWVGHSLMVGQSFLRLTASSPHYKQVPEYIGETHLLRFRDDMLKA